MSDNKEQTSALIYASVDELNALMGNNHRLKKSLETIILKDGKGLDSLGFVNLFWLVEEKCQEQFGKKDMNSSAKRGLLISDFNIENLSAYLTNDGDAPAIESVIAPYNQVS